MLDCPPGRAIASRPTKSPGSNPGKTSVFQGGSRGQTSFRRRQRRGCRGSWHAAGILRRTPIRRTRLPSSTRSRRAALPMWSAGRLPRCSSRILKQPVIIETKAGAAGQVGGQVAATAKPDGYTLLIHIVSISGFAEVDKTVRPRAEIHARRFHSDRAAHRRPDGSGRQRPARRTRHSRSWSTTPRNVPTSSSSARPGLYGALHLPTALFMKAAGIKMKSSADQRRRSCANRHPWQQLAGAGSSIAAASGQIKAGKLRALACF